MDKSSGPSSSTRPFYELPAHIKPCSRIIQETRLQLRYSTSSTGRGNVVEYSDGGSGGGRLGAGDLGALSGVSGSGGNNGNGYFELPDIERDVSRSRSPLAFGMGGMRPVQTQRPFTPRDSISLWGVSARKRPPSAITLSRLSIEEVDESTSSRSRPDSSLNGPFGRLSGQSYSAPTQSQSGSGQSGRLKTLVPKNSLGTLPSQISSLSEFSQTTSDLDLEKARLKVKSLSLDKVTSASTGPGRSKNHHHHGIHGSGMEPSWVLGFINDNDEHGNKKSRLSDVDLDVDGGGGGGGGDGSETDIDASSPKTSDPNLPQNTHVGSLQVAIRYLRCFTTDGNAQKSDVVTILKQIRDTLASGEISGAEKRQLLHIIFKLVEKNQSDADILFWSSFVLLHCNIIGNNLTTVFKMVFKSSRSKDYKDIIKDTEYLDVLMKSFSQICPKTQTESMIYGYGTLKFICGESDVLNRIVELGLVPIMALHLKILNCEIAEMGRSPIPDAIFNGTFQLTSILRSVVGEDRSLGLVVRSGLLGELCKTLNWTVDDIDVLTTTVRILSVVSMDRTCCEVMFENEVFCGAVVRVLKHWYSKDDVMVRLTYCLGNLLAHSDDMRVKLYEEPEAFQYILRVLSHYTEKAPSTPITIDILVKTTRILANWILNPFVGSEICDDPELSELLFGVLQLKEISQELCLCVMCTLNNTSFYMNYNELDEGTVKTVEYLYQNLEMKDLDARTEGMKVLGNLTRNEDVRLLASEYMESILVSLEDDGPELLCATFGVLINVIVEEHVKPEFLRKKGIERVIRALEHKNNTMVSLMACQVMWNLLISHENQGFDSNLLISPEKKAQLKRILMDKLQRPLILGATTTTTTTSSALQVKDGSGDGDVVSDKGEQKEIETELTETDDDNLRYRVILEDFQQVAQDLISKL